MLLPELTHEFLHNFGVHTPEQLRELIQVVLHAAWNISNGSRPASR